LSLCGFLAASLALAGSARAQSEFEIIGDATAGTASYGLPALRESGPAMGVPVAWDAVNRRGLGCTPTGVTKYVLDDTDDPMPVPVGVLDIAHEFLPLRAAVVDAVGGCAYYAAAGDPARILKIAFGAPNDPPVLVGTLTLAPGEGNVASAVIDEASGYACFGTDTAPGRIVKVRLGAADEAPTRVGALALDAGEDRLLCAVADPTAGRAYFGSASSGKVVTIDMGEGDAPPTRLGALELGDEGMNLHAATIDVPSASALFVAEAGRVIRIATGGSSELPTRISAFYYGDPGTAFAISSGVVDPATGDAFVGMGRSRTETDCYRGCLPPCPQWCITDGTAYVSLLHVAMREGMLVRGSAQLVRAEVCIGDYYHFCPRPPVPSAVSVALDSETGNAYVESGDALLRVGTDSRGALRGSIASVDRPLCPLEMRFLSHEADGNLRFAIYRRFVISEYLSTVVTHSHGLVWQSGEVPNTGQGSEVVVPMSAGTPSAPYLAPGSYLLAWQTDSALPVGSLGELDSVHDSITLAQPFETSPESFSIRPSRTVAAEHGRWTQYLVADPSPPDIAIALDGVDIPNGGGPVDFGVVDLGGAPVRRTFTVSNVGENLLSVRFADAPDGFRIGDSGTRWIVPGASATFMLELQTWSEGMQSGNVTIETNDPDENPFKFAVQGVVDGTFLDARGLDFASVEPRRHGNAPLVLAKTGATVFCDFGSVAVYPDGGLRGIAQIALLPPVGDKAATVIDVPVAGRLRYDAEGDAASTNHRVRLRLSGRRSNGDGGRVAVALDGARNVRTPLAVDPAAASLVDGKLSVAWTKHGKGAVEDSFDLGEPRVVRCLIPNGYFSEECGVFVAEGDAPARVGDERWSGGASVGIVRVAQEATPGTFSFLLENRSRICRIEGMYPSAEIPSYASVVDRVGEQTVRDFRSAGVRMAWRK